MCLLPFSEKIKGYCCFALCLLASLSTLHAINILNYSDESNDRFTNDPAFIASGFDLSGVGRVPAAGWLTMISPNVAIGANHVGLGSTVFFYPDNDPGSTPVSRVVVDSPSTSLRIGDTDLKLYVLDEAVPSSIAFYDFATAPLTDVSFASSSLANEEIFLVGRSPTRSPTNLDQAFGQNRLAGFFENSEIMGFGTDLDLLATIFNDGVGDPNASAFESQLEGGDSGAPAFLIQGGQLQLLGVNTAIGTLDPGGETVSLISYTGNDAAAIQNFINANAIVVPEPEAALLGLLALAQVLTWRRRRLS